MPRALNAVVLVQWPDLSPQFGLLLCYCQVLQKVHKFGKNVCGMEAPSAFDFDPWPQIWTVQQATVATILSFLPSIRASPIWNLENEANGFNSMELRFVLKGRQTWKMVPTSCCVFYLWFFTV